MDNRDVRLERQDDTHPSGDDKTLEKKKDWQEPKLTFVEPVLTPHGTLTSVTGTFFGAFSPSGD